MRSGCCRPVVVVSQAYPGNAEVCPGFPPPQVALVTAAAGDKGLWVVWCSSDGVRLRQREGNPHPNNVRVITVRWRASLLSLESGDGINVLVGQKRSAPKIAESIQYNKYSTVQ